MDNKIELNRKSVELDTKAEESQNAIQTLIQKNNDDMTRMRTERFKQIENAVTSQLPPITMERRNQIAKHVQELKDTATIEELVDSDDEDITY
jgi:hypothetical protein